MIFELKPIIVWNLFDQISKIPRETGNETHIRRWIEKWCDQHKIQYQKDKIGNLCIFHPGHAEFTDVPRIGLQAHLDMVCVKEEGSKHDFKKDSLQLYHENNYVFAKGTSLGADNGIGISIALSLLIDPSICHGPLEVILTVGEEKDCRGAKEMDPNFFQSKHLVNLDATQFGEIIIGSVGMLIIEINCPIDLQKPSTNLQEIIITLSGLKGGHSGLYAATSYINAIKSLTQILIAVEKISPLQIVSFTGGEIINSIPDSATVKLLAQEEKISEIIKELETWNKFFIGKKKIEPKLTFTYEIRKKSPSTSFTFDQSHNLIACLNEIPNEIISWSQNLPNTIETSTQLSKIHADSTKISISTVTRSLISEDLDRYLDRIRNLILSINGKITIEQKMPAWNGDLESNFAKNAKQIFYSLFGKKIALKKIHAGMEPSYFFNKSEKIHIISLGANLQNIHTINESVEIQSVELLYMYLKKLIQNKNLLTSSLI